MGKSKLALAGLLVGISSFISLLGVEKAVLAVLFGSWALKEAIDETGSKKLAWAGVILGLVYLVVLAVVVIIYFPTLISLLEKLK